MITLFLDVLELSLVVSGLLLWFAVFVGYIQKRRVQRESKNADWRKNLQDFYNRRGK